MTCVKVERRGNQCNIKVFDDSSGNDVLVLKMDIPPECAITIAKQLIEDAEYILQEEKKQP